MTMILFVGMPFVVKKDELPDPVPIRRLGAQRKLLEAHDLPQLLPQTRLRIGHQTVRPAECCFSRFHILPFSKIKSLSTSGKTRNKVKIMKGDIPQKCGIPTS